MSALIFSRRKFLQRLTVALGTSCLGACDQLSQNRQVKGLLRGAEGLNLHLQKRLARVGALAQEFSAAEISPAFPANGSLRPTSPLYQTLAAGNFADWRLQLGGLVRQAREFSLGELQAFPRRDQITRHDCVEGWSAIAHWGGVPLATLLNSVQPLPTARYVVFYCADQLDGSVPYYESIDLEDAYHPQTLLAYAMNHQPLSIPHGAPLRLRVERQLGYKSAKFLMRIDVVEDFAGIAGGKGGYWEDRGYEWFAGI